MTTHLKPADAAQALEAVRWAISEETPLELVGHGTKRALGRPFQATHTLDMSDLTGVKLYEPEELVLSAQAGTPLAELEALLAENRQQFAFEPPDFGPLLGGEAGKQTIGGVVSCNLAGPRRVKAGAARDHFLGCQAVSGRGEAFKAGGRVVKNVTGYDLPKLLAGSYGTLALLTEVTLKVLPAPADTRTVLIRGLDDATAIRVMALALQSPYEVAGAAHVPAALAGGVGVEELGSGTAATAIRLEGFGPSIEYRAGKFRDLFRDFGSVEFLEREPSLAFWAAVRDVKPFVARPERLVWRLVRAAGRWRAGGGGYRVQASGGGLFRLGRRAGLAGGRSRCRAGGAGGDPRCHTPWRRPRDADPGARYGTGLGGCLPSPGCGAGGLVGPRQRIPGP